MMYTRWLGYRNRVLILLARGLGGEGVVYADNMINLIWVVVFAVSSEMHNPPIIRAKANR